MSTGEERESQRAKGYYEEDAKGLIWQCSGLTINHQPSGGASINAHGVVSKVRLTHIGWPYTVVDSYYSCNASLCLKCFERFPNLVRYLINFSPKHRKQIVGPLSSVSGGWLSGSRCTYFWQPGCIIRATKATKNRCQFVFGQFKVVY